MSRKILIAALLCLVLCQTAKAQQPTLIDAFIERHGSSSQVIQPSSIRIIFHKANIAHDLGDGTIYHYMHGTYAYFAPSANRLYMSQGTSVYTETSSGFTGVSTFPVLLHPRGSVTHVNGSGNFTTSLTNTYLTDFAVILPRPTMWPNIFKTTKCDKLNASYHASGMYCSLWFDGHTERHGIHGRPFPCLNLTRLHLRKIGITAVFPVGLRLWGIVIILAVRRIKMMMFFVFVCRAVSANVCAVITSLFDVTVRPIQQPAVPVTMARYPMTPVTLMILKSRPLPCFELYYFYCVCVCSVEPDTSRLFYGFIRER